MEDALFSFLNNCDFQVYDAHAVIVDSRNASEWGWIETVSSTTPSPIHLLPLAIQQNRDPIGYTKRTRRYPPVKSTSTNNMGVSPSMAVPQSQSPQQSVNELTAEQMAEDVLLTTLMQVENQVEKLR